MLSLLRIRRSIEGEVRHLTPIQHFLPMKSAPTASCLPPFMLEDDNLEATNNFQDPVRCIPRMHRRAASVPTWWMGRPAIAVLKSGLPSAEGSLDFARATRILPGAGAPGVKRTDFQPEATGDFLVICSSYFLVIVSVAVTMVPASSLIV